MNNPVTRLELRALEQLARPIYDLLKQEGYPYREICITMEGMKIKEEIASTPFPNHVANGCDTASPKETIYETVEQIKIRKNDTTTIIWDAVMIQQMEKDLEDIKKRSGLIPSRLKETPFNMKDNPIAVAFPDEDSLLLKRSELSIAYRPIDLNPTIDDVWMWRGWYLVKWKEGCLDVCESGPFTSYNEAEKEFYSLPE